MGKYNGIVRIGGDNTGFENDLLTILEKIANELAESNRLKRLEMKQHVWRNNPAEKKYPVHDLEDQA